MESGGKPSWRPARVPVRKDKWRCRCSCRRARTPRGRFGSLTDGVDATPSAWSANAAASISNAYRQRPGFTVRVIQADRGESRGDDSASGVLVPGFWKASSFKDFCDDHLLYIASCTAWLRTVVPTCPFQASFVCLLEEQALCRAPWTACQPGRPRS